MDQCLACMVKLSDQHIYVAAAAACMPVPPGGRSCHPYVNICTQCRTETSLQDVNPPFPSNSPLGPKGWTLLRGGGALVHQFPLSQMTSRYCLSFAQKKDGIRSKGKVVGSVLGGRIYSIPCHAIYLNSVELKETVEFNRFLSNQPR